MKLSKHFITLGACVTALAVAMPVLLHTQREIKQAKALTEKDLATIIGDPTGTFDYSNSEYNFIAMYTIAFPLSEDIYTHASGYFNDHLNEYKDSEDNTINIADGIIINNQTLRYWTETCPSPNGVLPNGDGNHRISEGGNGVVDFPMSAAGVHSPASLYIGSSNLTFRLHTQYFPMGNITITFKAGIFKGYNNDTNYSLSEDLTYYTTLETDPSKCGSSSISPTIRIVQERNETIVNGRITSVSSPATHTKYYQYQITTNIPRHSNINQSFPHDHYRYLFENIMIGDLSLAAINAKGREENKDFTDLQAGTLNTNYETEHPGGQNSPKYNMVTYLRIENSYVNYVFTIDLPKQLITDYAWDYQNIEFSLANFSPWYSQDSSGNPLIVRTNPSAFTTLINNSLNELTELEDTLHLYRQADRETLASLIDVARDNIPTALLESDINAMMEAVRNAFANTKTDEELTKQEHVDTVVALIDAIPENITFTEACKTAINSALEAYIALTSEEKELVPSEKVDALYAAYNAFNTLDVNNYKALAKEEIDAKINVNLYREAERAAVKPLVDTAKANIDAASFKEQIEDILTNLYAAVAPYKNARVLAIEEIDALDISGLKGEKLTKANDIISKAKLSIENCQTAEEVDIVLTRTKTLIDALKKNYDVDLTTVTVVQKKGCTGSVLTPSIIISSVALVGVILLLIRKRKTEK